MVTDQYSDSGQATYTIGVGFCVPTVTPASLPSVDVGVLISPPIQFTASGCPGYTYTYSEQPVSLFGPGSTLPPGVQLNAGGTFSGTPTTAGTYSFLVVLTDQTQNQTQLQYSLTVAPPPSFTTTSPLPNAPVGVPYSQQIKVTGGVPPYNFSSISGNVPGISCPGSCRTTGILSGTPTTAGTYTFNIGVTDSLGASTVGTFKVTFTSAVSQILVTPLSLTFNSTVGGGSPPTQAINLTPATGSTPPVNYRVLVDNGQSGGAAPAWITVTPTSGGVPAGLVVSVNQGTMTEGAYTARIQIIDGNGLPTLVPVTLNVATSSAQLNVAPSSLSFSARSSTPETLTGQLVVTAAGTSSLSFSTAVVGGSSWITGVKASSNTTSGTAPVFVQVQVNTAGLAVGSYNDTILVTSSAGTIGVPVSLFVAASGPILAVNTTGVLFQAIQGGGSTENQVVKILNLGDPNSTVNWTASLVNGSNWLNVVNTSGTATPNNPGSLTLALAANATQLSPGPYYAVVQVSDSNSRNSPQFVSAVLNLAASNSAPSLQILPGGLFFTTVFGGLAPAAQKVQINTSSSSAVTFNATANTFGTGNWLSVTPASGTASGQTAGSVSVSVNPSGLGAGIYSGNVSISIGATLQSANVTFVVQPAGSSSAVASGFKPEATACTPSKLAITETGLPNNFSAPAGWPATLIVQLNNDCGAAVANGSVVASFSNGDAPLTLAGDELGNYSSTWQPSSVNSNMVVTLNATAGTLAPASAQLSGGVAANATPPPVLSQGGIVNNLNSQDTALAPGTIAAVYGTGLGTAPQSTGLPLPTSFNNTFALIGSTKAPLYFVSANQVNLQIPNEATATQQLPIVLSVNNAVTLPQMLNIIPAAPGVAAFPNRFIIAQHGADYSLVTTTSPAKPGEYLIMYLVGMGPTNPPVATGAVTPSTLPLAAVTAQPTVTVDSQNANVAFAGLTPGSVGLYQINFQVPATAKSGNLNVDVTQNGVAANETVLPVSQ